MRNPTLAAVAGSVLAITGLAAGQTTINTISAWQASAFPSQTVGWDKIAQTFRVPPTATTLSTWRAGVRSQNLETYSLQVFTWNSNGNHTTGSALFDSGPLVAPTSLTFVQHTIGIELLPDTDYAVVVDWVDIEPVPGHVAFFTSASTQGGYPDGYAAFTIPFLPQGSPWDFDQSDDFETGFAATFEHEPWADLGSALAGTYGDPVLVGDGRLTAGDPVTLTLSNALENTTTTLVVAIDTLNAPFGGGTLVPQPTFLFPLDTLGGASAVGGPWPPGVPPGFTFYAQHWIDDPAGPLGWAASNAISGTTP